MEHNLQNRFLAEFCGWSQIENKNTIVIGGVWYGYPPREAIIGQPEKIHDYVNDLNWIRNEVEESLKAKGLLHEYWHELWLICEPRYAEWFDRGCYSIAELLGSFDWSDFDNIARATSMQRAEAALKTIKKWGVKDDSTFPDPRVKI